jgi:hypothetical protein
MRTLQTQHIIFQLMALLQLTYNYNFIVVHTATVTHFHERSFTAIVPSTQEGPNHRAVCQENGPSKPAGSRHAPHWPDGEIVTLESKIPPVLPEKQVMQAISCYVMYLLLGTDHYRSEKHRGS